jgi:alginate O-acetyltransferase complex protein AlgJ
MTLAKLSLLLFLPLFAVVGEYTFRNQTIPSRKQIKKYIDDGSNINLYVKKVGVSIKELIGSQKFGNICLGKNDYLFYCPEQEGSPLMDLYGNFHPTERHFKMPLQDVLKNHNDRLFYITVPNKSRILSHLIPYDIYFTSKGVAPWMSIDSTNILNSKNYLSVGQLEEILKNFEPYPTYYKQDTHWNNWGAYIALKALSLPETSEELKFKVDNYPTPDIVQLSNSIGKDIPPSDQKIIPINYLTRIDGDEKSILKFYNDKKTYKVLVVGDSFRTSISPVLAQYFGQVDEVHLNNFTKHQLNLNEYKYIFLIQVERYLRGQFQ